MNKKIFLTTTIVIILVTIVISILTPHNTTRNFLQTIPLLPSSQQSPSAQNQTSSVTGTSKQTNISNSIKEIDSSLSQTEKNKLSTILPVRINDFSTSVNIKTTINVYSFQYDPSSVLRIEIYGINYNDSEINGVQATAFKESFTAAKSLLLTKNVNLKNLQIIYGNRQYIQDTASYWVQTFKLLD